MRSSSLCYGEWLTATHDWISSSESAVVLRPSDHADGLSLTSPCCRRDAAHPHHHHGAPGATLFRGPWSHHRLGAQGADLHCSMAGCRQASVWHDEACSHSGLCSAAEAAKQRELRLRVRQACHVNRTGTWHPIPNPNPSITIMEESGLGISIALILACDEIRS